MFRSLDLVFQGIFIFLSLEELLRFQNGASLQVKATSYRGKFACQDDVMRLRCASSKVLKVYRATYSRTQKSVCRRLDDESPIDAVWCDPVDRTVFVQGKCDGLMTCNVTVNNNTMGEVCADVFKFLNVIYVCHEFKPTKETVFAQNKSTMVLTKPPLPASSSLTEKPTEKAVLFQVVTTKNEEDSTEAGVDFVADNGGSVHEISCGLLALVQLAIFNVLLGAQAFS